MEVKLHRDSYLNLKVMLLSGKILQGFDTGFDFLKTLL